MKTLPVAIIACALCLTAQTSYAFGDKEKYAGYYIDRAISGNNVLLFDDQTIGLIQKITGKLTRAVGTKDHFTFRILNSQAINAFATPGGFIYLTTGLLDFVESKDELATIIAHEMAHAIEAHYMGALSDSNQNAGAMDVMVGLAGIGLAVVGPLVPSGEALGAAANSFIKPVSYALIQGVIQRGLYLSASVIHTAMVAGYSRQREIDADVAAVKYVRLAGYNPRAMIAFLKRLSFFDAKRRSIKDGGYVSKLINAEPGINKRIEKLEKLVGTP